MDYLNEAFGGFSPQTDRDAAAKFALNALMMDDRLPRLLELLTPHSDTGGVAGEPGWLLERRDANSSQAGYEGWPPGAAYRASVDVDSYALRYPEAYYERAQFAKLVHLALTAYLVRKPERRSELRDLCALVGFRKD